MKTTKLILIGLLALIGLSNIANAQVMVKDINPGPGSSIQVYPSLVNANGTLYFYAYEDTHGAELWKSDGTTAGTVMVKDIVPGSGFGIYSAYAPTNVNGTVYFVASDGINGIELWKSNGTDAGTVMVKDIKPGSSGSMSWGQSPLFTNVNGTLYFRADDGTNGEELWKSDGTAAGTVMVKDIKPGSTGSSPKNFINFNGTLYFSTDGGLWKSDGTAAGTVIVSSSGVSGLINVNGTLYFSGLWKSDGTTAGTVIVKSVADPSGFTDVNGTLYFSADGAKELWKSDGTAAGTVLVKDPNPSVFGASNISSLTNVNGILYFTATDGTNGTELWKSNGTAAGTVMVKDIWTGNNSNDIPPSSLININNTLYFAAYDVTNGKELWKSDGTTAGTVMVKDIWTGGAGSSLKDFTNVNGTLYFAANNSTNGMELWKYIIVTGISQTTAGLPENYALSQNYPNPFNPSTNIKFSIPKSSFVTLKVYDVLGKEVAVLVNEYKPAGNYNVNFDASKLTSGIYFYKLQAGNFTSTKKMVLMR